MKPHTLDILAHWAKLSLSFAALLVIFSGKENKKTARKMMPVKPTSKYEGVTKAFDRWRARIFVNGRRRSLGLYDTEIEAYQAYLNFKKYHQEGKGELRVSTNNDSLRVEHCGCCADSVVDEKLKVKDPSKFILVNQKKVYFCDDKCMRYYISQPEILARYNELGFL